MGRGSFECSIRSLLLSGLNFSFDQESTRDERRAAVRTPPHRAARMPWPSGMRSGRRDVAIRSWPGFERSGASPGREAPAAVRGEGARGSGERCGPSPVGPGCGPGCTGLRPSGLGIIKPSRAEPSRAEPSRAEPSRAEPSRAEPMRAPPARRRASSRPDSPPAPARARHSDAPRPSAPKPSLSPRLAAGRRRQPSRRGCIRRGAAAWLLALVALPVASGPVSAQTEIWSATLTVDAASANAVGYVEGFFGTLSDTDFVRDGTTHDVIEIYENRVVDGGRFVFVLDPALADTCGLVLELDDSKLNFRDMSAAGRDIDGYAYVWEPSALGWTDNQSVVVKLVVSDGSPCAPTGLNATAQDGQVALAWTAGGSGDSAITGHQVCRKEITPHVPCSSLRGDGLGRHPRQRAAGRCQRDLLHGAGAGKRHGVRVPGAGGERGRRRHLIERRESDPDGHHRAGAHLQTRDVL